MLFQGQEFAASSPFFYFADHNAELSELVFKGRKEFFRQFRSLAVPEVLSQIPNPSELSTFEACRLDFGERERHAEIYRLHEDLLRLRRDDPGLQSPARPLDGAVLGEHCFLLRFFAPGSDRLLVVNFGRDLHLTPAPEPLLAPPPDCRWTELWSSEDLKYGGGGTASLETEEGWRIPGEAAVLLAPHVIEPASPE
jgi:maltooligosyltrehalose trehalohydrolase